MWLNFVGLNQIQLKSYTINKIESLLEFIGKKQHPINSAPTNSKTEFILNVCDCKHCTELH